MRRGRDARPPAPRKEDDGAGHTRVAGRRGHERTGRGARRPAAARQGRPPGRSPATPGLLPLDEAVQHAEPHHARGDLPQGPGEDLLEPARRKGRARRRPGGKGRSGRRRAIRALRAHPAGRARPARAAPPTPPADVLAKLLTVDGAGSGLDADLLGGLPAAATSSASPAPASPAAGVRSPPTAPSPADERGRALTVTQAATDRRALHGRIPRGLGRIASSTPTVPASASSRPRRRERDLGRHRSFSSAAVIGDSTRARRSSDVRTAPSAS